MSYVGIGNRQDYIADFPTQSFNGDGSTTTFTLNFEAVTGSVRVAVDNVLQPADGTAYYTNGNSITFTSAPATGTANITVTYLGTVRNVSSVSDGAITTAKLADGAVTNAKLQSGSFTNITDVGTLASGLTLSDNLLFDTASKGVYLGTTTATASNLLDDYEEGTFTVTNAGDATGALSAETGEYTKVGNIVFIRITFDVSTNFTSFGRIGGLPFTTNGDNSVSSFYPASVMTDNSVNNQILPNFHISQTYMTLKEDDTNANEHFPNTTNNIYRICGFYFTNS